MIGADIDECVLVTNTTTGINVILRNFQWEEGDIMVPCKDVRQVCVNN
jgi:selenocysteine lyase/cysteine desulfurase